MLGKDHETYLTNEKFPERALSLLSKTTGLIAIRIAQRRFTGYTGVPPVCGQDVRIPNYFAMKKNIIHLYISNIIIIFVPNMTSHASH